MGCLANKNGKTGSGVGETRLPETTVSNRFSIFQVGKSSGTCETADLTSSPVAETESIENSIPSAGTTESTSTLSIAPAVTISHPPAGEDIARTWGSSSNWMLELRDGRRITIPFFLIRSMPSQEGEGEWELLVVVAPIEDGDIGSTVEGQSSRLWVESGSDEAEEEDDVSIAWEDPIPVASGGDIVCWADEETPLEVASLAMAGPAVEGLEIGGEPKVGVERRDSNSPTQVVEQFQEFGLELGVSFEGFEEELLILLKAIEERRNSHSGPVGDRKKMQKSGGKGSRELKNLISTINYDASGSKNRGLSRERALSVYQ